MTARNSLQKMATLADQVRPRSMAFQIDAKLGGVVAGGSSISDKNQVKAAALCVFVTMTAVCCCCVYVRRFPVSQLNRYRFLFFRKRWQGRRVICVAAACGRRPPAPPSASRSSATWKQNKTRERVDRGVSFSCERVAAAAKAGCPK